MLSMTLGVTMADLLWRDGEAHDVEFADYH